MQNQKAVALIPARAGSKRIANKNIKLLGGHPLVAYTIKSAIKSGVFDSVICATDDTYYAEIARAYGAEVPFLRPQTISGDKSPDIEWVTWMLRELKSLGRNYEIFSILRPTSPFRRPSTIQSAWKTFIENPLADSLRAVEKCSQHPGKMWVVLGKTMQPLMPLKIGGVPWHSNQSAALPEIYVQNASLEIAWSRVALDQESLTGEIIAPFITKGLEGFDINDTNDWVLAEHYIKECPLDLW